MIRFTNSVTIECAQPDVFAYLAEFENLPEWNYAIASTRKLDSGPIAVGSRYAQIRTVPTYSEETFEVIELVPGCRLTIRGTFGPFSGDLSYQLDPVGSGDATVVTNTASLEARRGLSLVAPLVTRQIKSAVAANLDVLRQTLERASPPSHRSRDRKE